MDQLVLYRASLRHNLIVFRRYVFDTVSGLVSIYGFFLVIFFGARIFGGNQPGFGENIEGVVVAYGMWALTVFALGTLTFELTQEAQLGTLEQLGMSPFGLVRVLVARAFTSMVVYFAIFVVLLTLMMATTGRWLNIDVLSVVPLLLITLVGVVGLGFVLAGFAIVFKRVSQALQVYQVLVIGLVVVDPTEIPFVKYLPLSWGSHLVASVMVDEASIFGMPASDLLFLVVNSAAYFFTGIGVFKLFERAARERGLLGHY